MGDTNMLQTVFLQLRNEKGTSNYFPKFEILHLSDNTVAQKNKRPPQYDCLMKRPISNGRGGRKKWCQAFELGHPNKARLDL